MSAGPADGAAAGRLAGGGGAALALAACALAIGAGAAGAAWLPAAHAENVTFSTAQSEYYFVPGERPAIPLDLRNDHGRAVAGLLSFTVSQDSGQGNVQTRTVNAGSQRFEVRAGNNTVMIDLGAVAPPARLEVDLSFSYNDGFDPWTVEIGPIVAHVVGDPSEARNEPSPMSGQAQAGAGGQQQQGQPGGQQQGQGGQGQGQRQQPGGQQQGQGGQGQGQPGGQQQGQGGQGQQGQGGQPPAPDPLDRLQNNQMAQDSAALRRQIQSQLQEEAASQNRFAETLSADPVFAEQHRRMLGDGYEVAGGSLDPLPGEEEGGAFEIQYQSPERGSASIRGEMEGGRVTEMDVRSEYEERRMLEALHADARFAEMSAELEAAGYTQSGSQFSSDGSAAEAVLEYSAPGAAGEGEGGEGEGAGAKQARVRAEFNGTHVTAVSLEYGEEDDAAFDPARAILAAAVAGGIAAAAYMALRGQGAEPAAPPAVPPPGAGRRGDPGAEAGRLMGEARRLHAAGDEKGAFARAGRAVRVLVSARLGMDREVTNAEVAGALAARRAEAGAASIDGGGARACLGVASLVEFARMSPGGGDFERLSSLFDMLAAGGGGNGGGAAPTNS